jgi:uncharacterized membrane protein
MSAEARLKFTLLCGLPLSVFSSAWAAQANRDLVGWMFWLIWPAMVLHQCEENVFTELVLGQEYRFTRWVRTVGYDISPSRALELNVLVGWTLAIASGFSGSRFAYIPLFVAAVEAVNGFWHLSVTALQQRWSPGTLSSVLVTIPLGCFLFYKCFSGEVVSRAACMGLFLAACVAHHVFLGSLPKVKRADKPSQ